MNKKRALQATAAATAFLWLALSGCSGMSGGSGCGGGSSSGTGCTGSAPQCAKGFYASCQTNNSTGSTSYVCVQN